MSGHTLASERVQVLDGGLATELERRGRDLSGGLWSARLLLDDPGAIAEVHRAYLEAGADCIVTASYQASEQGFVAAGYAPGDARRALLDSVRIAVAERDRVVAASAGRRPLVAASVGPWGAVLADGSEYRGDYACSEEELRAFHEDRWGLLAESASDLIACETIPSESEVRVLVDLFRATPAREGWISVSCRDGSRASDGTPIERVAACINDGPPGVGIGINCTPPRYVTSLLERIRAIAPDRFVVVYPNSGERWDAVSERWCGTGEPLVALAREWWEAGADAVGGCCRTTPALIADLDAQRPRQR